MDSNFNRPFGITHIKCCKDCKKRTVGCHSTCDVYIAERAKFDEERKDAAVARQAHDDFMRIVGVSKKERYQRFSNVAYQRKHKGD